MSAAVANFVVLLAAQKYLGFGGWVLFAYCVLVGIDFMLAAISVVFKK